MERDVANAGDMRALGRFLRHGCAGRELDCGACGCGKDPVLRTE
jgi:hypothetical protein